MVAISRMKSILNPKFSTLSPHLPKTKAIPFALISRAHEFMIRNNPIQIPNYIRLSSTPVSSNNFICCAQYRNLHMEASRPCSGEIHVIVGPMFAGKTIALLQRIQLESDNGRLHKLKQSSCFRYHCKVS